MTISDLIEGSFVVPADRRWRSLVTRLGAPKFLVFSGRPILAIRGTQNGKPLAIAAQTFTAPPGAQVRLFITFASEAVHRTAYVAVVPRWNPESLQRWEATLPRQDENVLVAFQPLFFMAGVGVIFVAALIGLLPLEPTR